MVWQGYARALGASLLGLALGCLYVLVSWSIGDDARHALSDPWPLVVTLVAIGLVAERWLSPAATVAVAAAFLAALAILVLWTEPGDEESAGRWPGAAVPTLVFGAFAFLCTLAGHALASSVRRGVAARRRGPSAP